MIYFSPGFIRGQIRAQIAARVKVAGGRPLAAALKAKNFVEGLLILDDLFEYLEQSHPAYGLALEEMRMSLVHQLKGEFVFGLIRIQSATQTSRWDSKAPPTPRRKAKPVTRREALAYANHLWPDGCGFPDRLSTAWARRASDAELQAAFALLRTQHWLSSRSDRSILQPGIPIPFSSWWPHPGSHPAWPGRFSSLRKRTPPTRRRA